jgi:hypothetical protein
MLVSIFSSLYYSDQLGVKNELKATGGVKRKAKDATKQVAKVEKLSQKSVKASKENEAKKSIGNSPVKNLF